MQRLCHPVPYGPMQRFCHPAHFFLFYLSYLTCYLSLCTSAKQLLCEPRNVLQSGPRFDFIQLSVSFISEPMQRLCHPVPYGPMQRLCHPAHFSLSFFCCMSKLSIQVLSMVRIVKSYSWLRPPCSNPKHSNSNCKSQVPDSLSCFSLWDTRQRTNYTTALLLSQDTLQSSNAANLVELHASLLVVQDVQSTWPKVRKGNPPGSINITSILFANSTGNHHSKTIKLISQQNHLADISMLIHPSREVRYGCSKPKGEYLHSNYLHTKSSQSDNNSRVPTCLSAPYTFSASVPVLTTTSVQVSQDNCNNPSRESHTWSVCDTKQLLKFRSKKKTWKQTHSKVSCFVSSSGQNSFHFLHSSGRFHWLTVLHAQLKHFHNCSSNQGCYLMHLRNQDQHSQTDGTYMSSLSQSVVNQQSQHQVPLCLQCHDGSYLSLSQHSSTYIARQTTMLQASISRSPVRANIRQAPLFLHITEPQVFNYSRLTSQMWQINQGHWQSKLDPPGSHATISLSHYHLQAWRQAQ